MFIAPNSFSSRALVKQEQWEAVKYSWCEPLMYLIPASMSGASINQLVKPDACGFKSSKINILGCKDNLGNPLKPFKAVSNQKVCLKYTILLE